MKFNFCRKNRRSSINQKKYIFMTLVLCALLSGCSDGKVYDETQKEIDPDRIISMMNPAPSYTKSYGDFAAMAEESSVIVYGEIMGVDHYMNGNGLCATKIDVEIKQPLKGEFNEGDMIQIVEDQGIATVEEYINSYETEDLRETMRNDYQQYRDDELDDIYIQQLFYGDVMFETGQKYVFMLAESNDFDTQHTYSRINGPMGSFSELSDDHFYWTQEVGATLTEEYGENASNMSLEDVKIKGERPRTLNGLINEMDLCKRGAGSTSIDPDKIVTKTSGMVERAVTYPDPASLAGASSQIVYGEIESMEYRASMNGGCRTNLDVRVIESYKGSFQEGDIIRVVLDQGIITVKDYIDSMQSDALKEESRKGYVKYSDDELDDIYYQEIEYGDILAETGQRSIYFLEESNYYDTERTYCRVTGPEAAYLEISEDCFVKTINIGMIYAARDEGYTGEINGGNGLEGLSYTRQELVEQMGL